MCTWWVGLYKQKEWSTLAQGWVGVSQKPVECACSVKQVVPAVWIDEVGAAQSRCVSVLVSHQILKFRMKYRNCPVLYTKTVT